MNESRPRGPLRDKPLRYPGQSLDEEIRRLQWDIAGYFILAVVFIGLLVLEWWRWFRDVPPQPMAALFLAVIVVLISYLRIRQLERRCRGFVLGRDGERIVGQAIEELREKGFGIFHDIVGGDFNVDHVIISRHGIFSIETKTFTKPRKGEAKVNFDGERVTVLGKEPERNPVEQAIASANWLRRDVLEKSTGKLFPVKPVIVFPGWWVDETHSSKRIWVLNPDRLSSRISQEPQLLTEEEVHLIAFHLSRYVRGLN